MNAPAAPLILKNHDLVDGYVVPGIRYEKRPARTPDGKTVSGLYNAWIWLDNATQYNSYTTEMAKARRQLCRLHRRRGQSLLHRRQHQGVRRVLRRAAPGIPPIHAGIQ